MLWILSVLHRLGVILRGVLDDPEQVHSEIDWPPWMATIHLERSIRRWLWIVMIVLIGFAHPNEAAVHEVEDTYLAVGLRDHRTSALVPVSENVCAVGQDPVDAGDGSWYREALKACGLIGSWEILKWVRRRRNKPQKTAASQTMEGGYVPLPLPEGIPHQAEVLFSLWRATAEPYSEAVQSRFHGYLGNYLRAQARDEELSD